MNTPPIKRSKNLVTLSKDHHDGLLIAWKVRQGLRLNISNTRLSNFIVNQFNTHLHPHFVEEEQLLFSKLPSSDELRIKAEDQHAAIRQMIAAFDSAPESSTEDLANFANLLDDHIRLEERQLFPHLEKVVAPDELDLIGKDLERLHATKPADEWHDQFWIKK